MRYLVCLVAGIALGAMVASMMVNASALRNAWPRGVMNVMQHELGDAREAARVGKCDAAATQSASAHLRLLASDIEPALLAPGAKDQTFSKYASDLRDALTKWNIGADCAQQADSLTTIAHTCDACHRDYR
jgi:hypothetical protein